MQEHRLTRRRLLASARAGVATAAGVAALGPTPSASAEDDAATDSNGRQLADAVLAAFIVLYYGTNLIRHNRVRYTAITRAWQRYE